ncbi:MAG: hypothetical protein QM597_01505, partial [Aeromicrobium sp.]|uniref:hypothetical protein n=1 Tax=Aeromicrobium sp. TaxID=1871063 RepID=UPI0039E51344
MNRIGGVGVEAERLDALETAREVLIFAATRLGGWPGGWDREIMGSWTATSPPSLMSSTATGD